MAERVQLAGDTLLAVFMRQMLEGQKVSTNNLYCDVVLTVNGKEVPFIPTMEDFFGMIEAEAAHKAKTLAEDMVTEAGLRTLATALRGASVQVRRALHEAQQRL